MPKDLPPGDGDGVMVSFIIGTVRHRLAGAEAAAWVASGKPLNDDPSSPRDDCRFQSAPRPDTRAPVK